MILVLPLCLHSQERVWPDGDEAVAGHDRQAQAGGRRLAQVEAGRLRLPLLRRQETLVQHRHVYSIISRVWNRRTFSTFHHCMSLLTPCSIASSPFSSLHSNASPSLPPLSSNHPTSDSTRNVTLIYSRSTGGTWSWCCKGCGSRCSCLRGESSGKSKLGFALCKSCRCQDSSTLDSFHICQLERVTVADLSSTYYIHSK